MSADILVVTPKPNLGDSIRSMLSGGRFNVHITSDFSQAIRLVRQTGCLLALLDSALDEVDISVQDVAYALKQVNGDIHVVILANTSDTHSAASYASYPVLSKPIRLEDLQRIVAQVFPPEAPAPAAIDTPPTLEGDHPWLTDVRRAAQHLTRLTLESSAQAALITNDNVLWAYAGQLSQAAANELSQMVQRYWDWGSHNDLLRFVRLAATEQAHMLYATRLTTTMILALVFDGETPFSTIRSQAGHLAASLASQPDPGEEPANDLHDDARSFPHIATLLENVPPPIPAPKAAPTPPQAAEPVPVSAHTMRHSVESSPSQLRGETARTEMPPPARPAVLAADPESLAETRRATPLDDLAVTRKQAARPPDSSPQELAKTRPQQPAEGDVPVNRIVLEPASPALYNYNFACLLIPRFDTHHLVGDLADRLGEWVPQLCIAFGWRLEYLSIRPTYLQWVVNVPPSVPPGSIMKQVRQHTSERIFKEFPRLKDENPSGDYWAPGYLIMGGSQPHPPRFVKDFIQQTRRRQGLGEK